MKQYLRALTVWTGAAFAQDKVPWPETSKTANLDQPTVDTQTVDQEDEAYKRVGYNKDNLIQQKESQYSYYEEINQQGKDRVLGITMLEYVRRQAIKRNRNPSDFRIIFGSFVRTDQPSGDPDCSGALASLRFAQ